MELNIKTNPSNGGLCCYFSHNGNDYWADLCELLFGESSECMIFAAKDGKVTSWSDLYCKRGIPVTEAALTRCIEQFIKQLDK